MPKKISKKALSYLFIIIGSVIGFIGSLASIFSVLGYSGCIVSIITAIICYFIAIKFFRDSLNEYMYPGIKVKTHGNQSPGIVGGDYRVNVDDGPRDKN